MRAKGSRIATERRDATSATSSRRRGVGIVRSIRSRRSTGSTATAASSAGWVSALMRSVPRASTKRYRVRSRFPCSSDAGHLQQRHLAVERVGLDLARKRLGVVAVVQERLGTEGSGDAPLVHSGSELGDQLVLREDRVVGDDLPSGLDPTQREHPTAGAAPVGLDDRTLRKVVPGDVLRLDPPAQLFRDRDAVRADELIHPELAARDHARGMRVGFELVGADAALGEEACLERRTPRRDLTGGRQPCLQRGDPAVAAGDRRQSPERAPEGTRPCHGADSSTSSSSSVHSNGRAK